MKSGTDYWQVNPFSWNRQANMLYIEAPAGVGYSYCDETISACNTHNDQLTADENLTAVLAFFEKFPEFGRNDLYISGESYAGIYVPWLSYSID
jgi:carboxypeptidase C (cathepsin A)